MGFENKAWLACRTFRLRHHRVGRASLTQLPRGIGCVVHPTYLLSAPVCCLRARQGIKIGARARWNKTRRTKVAILACKANWGTVMKMQSWRALILICPG